MSKMPIKAINSKAEYYALAQAGKLGNTIRQWNVRKFDLERDLHPGSIPELVAVRGMEPASKEFQGYNLSHDEAMRRCFAAESRGLKALIDEQAPDDRSLIKGEIMRDEKYLYLRYDCTPGLRMREAFPVMKHAHGLQASELLRYYMDDSSWVCLNEIFDEYPDSIVEFTVYDHKLGKLGWNTIFWEVRNY